MNIPRVYAVWSTVWARFHTSSKKNSLKFPSGLQEFVLKVEDVCPPAVREVARRHSPRKEDPQTREEQHCWSVRQSSIKVLLPGGKQQSQNCLLHWNIACFTWKWFYSGIHLYRGTNKNKWGHAASHTSYKTLKENLKSFLASASPLVKQQLAGFPVTSWMLSDINQGPRVSNSLPRAKTNISNTQQPLPTMKQVVVKILQVLHHASRIRLKHPCRAS